MLMPQLDIAVIGANITKTESTVSECVLTELSFGCRVTYRARLQHGIYLLLQPRSQSHIQEVQSDTESEAVRVEKRHAVTETVRVC